MASPTNLHLETAVEWVLEHMVEMVEMDTASHATRMCKFRIITKVSAANVPNPRHVRSVSMYGQLQLDAYKI